MIVAIAATTSIFSAVDGVLLNRCRGPDSTGSCA
jgi:hypothetical protein